MSTRKNRNIYYFLSCFSVLALGLTITVPVLADEVNNPLADIPPPDELRFISSDDATSQCIGDPKTPLCAVETYLACRVRFKMQLCQKVGVKYFKFQDTPYTSRYRVVDAKILTECDMTEDLKDADWWKLGYADITLSELFVIKDGSTLIQKYSYIAHPWKTGWKVMSWSAWGDQDSDER